MADAIHNREEIISTLKALLAKLEGSASRSIAAPSAPTPAEQAPAPDGWKRARLGKVFDDGKKVAAYLNWRENGEERAELASTFDEALIALIVSMPPKSNVLYKTRPSKCGKYLNFVDIKLN